MKENIQIPLSLKNYSRQLVLAAIKPFSVCSFLADPSLLMHELVNEVEGKQGIKKSDQRKKNCSSYVGKDRELPYTNQVRRTQNS